MDMGYFSLKVQVLEPAMHYTLSADSYKYTQ